jgi:hypothetical protein
MLIINSAAKLLFGEKLWQSKYLSYLHQTTKANYESVIFVHPIVVYSIETYN